MGSRIKVTIDGKRYDLTKRPERCEVTQWVAAQIKAKHGPMADPLHPLQLDLDAVRVRCIPHRFGGGAVRLDGFCLHPDCMGEHGLGAVCLHQDYLLKWDGGAGHYIGDHEIGKLRPGMKRLLDDGSRWVDAMALKRLVEAMIEGAT